MRIKRLLSVMVLLVVLGFGFSAVLCQSNDPLVGTPFEGYPERTITIIVPFGPGGGTDVLTRLIVEFIDLPVGLTLKHVPGAAGQVGIREALVTRPDGYTIIGVNPTGPLGWYVTGAVDRMFWKELEPICTVVRDTVIILTHPNTGFETLEDALEFAKENPQMLKWAVPGLAGLMHFSTLHIVEEANIDITLVPYEGGARSRAALMGQHVELETASLSDAYPIIESGHGIPLAQATRDRSKRIPDIPTLPELGFDVAQEMFRSYYAPPGTPEPIIEYLRQAIKEVCKNPEFIRIVEEELAAEVYYLCGEETNSLVDQSMERWSKLYKEHME